MKPSVLIGCPTSDHKSYCLKKYIAGVKALTYPNAKVLIADNSKGDSYIKQIKEAGLAAIKSKWFEGARDRIIYARNLLKEIAIEEGFDYFFSLEQDVVPPPDVIERLLSHGKEIVTGVYFNRQVINKQLKICPLLYKSAEGYYDKLRFMTLDEVRKGGLQEIRAAGVGCMLIHRDVLEKVIFRYRQGFDDMMFCWDARKAGYKIYVDCSIQCEHYCRPWTRIRK